MSFARFGSALRPIHTAFYVYVQFLRPLDKKSYLQALSTYITGPCFLKPHNYTDIQRIRDVFPGSRIRIFSIPDPGYRVEKIPDPGSGTASKNLSILTQKIVSKLLEILSRMFIPDPDLDFFTHPGSRNQKGTGSRIRNIANIFSHPLCSIRVTVPTSPAFHFILLPLYSYLVLGLLGIPQFPWPESLAN